MFNLSRLKFSTLVVLITSIISVAFIFSGYYLFNNSINHKKQELQERANILSNIISSVAQFDAKHSKEKEFNFDSEKATLSQVIATFKAKNLSMEYLVAQKIDNKIVFKAYSKQKPPDVDLNAETLAVPMRKALNGLSGVVIESDYLGDKVFAAYANIEHTPWGLVIKQPYSEHIGPFNKIIFISIFVGLILIWLVYFSLHDYRQRNLELSRTHDDLNKSLSLLNENVISSSSDLRGVITRVSDALCKISGYTKEELIGQPHSILRHPDMSSQTFKEIWNTIQSGNIWTGEIKNSKKDGGYYWVLTTIVPEHDIDNKIIGYSSIRHDITPQKVKEEFMANMSHELRTPLNAIIGFSGILNKKQTNPEHIELSKEINVSANSLLGLINSILDLSKIKDSKFEIAPFEFNFYDEMVGLCSTFEVLSTKNTLIHKTNIADNLKGIFFGDWLRINQIILNLVSNAIKFTPKGGEIKINADYEGGSLVISISDNGIGMNKEVQDKVFEPFQQADGSTTRKYGGTGLGLSITQNLIELMNGKIELESEEGVGSTFTVTIPLDRVKTEQVQENSLGRQESEKTSLGVHVLVAEDNKTNQMLVEMLLEEFGVTCDIANDGLEALEMYNPEIHKMVLMDEDMPNMNGTESMQKIREKYQDRCGPIIALTASFMAGDREKFLEAGMDAYVSKPIDENILYNTMKDLLS